ncbi:unnamed protein product, partial [Symbiodinium sp. CCMP2592]
VRREQGKPIWRGTQLAIDGTSVNPVTRTGSARPGADTRARRARFVVVGIEAGRPAAKQRLLAPRGIALQHCYARLCGLLAIAATRAHAASLFELPPAAEACFEGEAPELHGVRAEEARRVLDRTNWTARPTRNDLLNNLRRAQCDLANGATAGSITVPALVLPTSAKPSCDPLCQPMPRPSSRSRGRIPPIGSSPPRARLAPLCRPTACSKRCGDGCGCLCQPAHTNAANMATAVVVLLMHTVTPMPPALVQAFPLAEPSPWSTPGCALLVRLSDLRARSSRTAGNFTACQVHGPHEVSAPPLITTPRLAAATAAPRAYSRLLQRTPHRMWLGPAKSARSPYVRGIDLQDNAANVHPSGLACVAML